MRIMIIAMGSRGDIQPYIALGTGLKAAGHFVRLMSHENTDYFPRLVSYNRMVELMPNVLTACLYYLKSRQGQVTGISFVDSTAIPVCHPKRINRNKVFKETAKPLTFRAYFFIIIASFIYYKSILCLASLPSSFRRS